MTDQAKDGLILMLWDIIDQFHAPATRIASLVIANQKALSSELVLRTSELHMAVCRVNEWRKTQ